ncbi:hypothetical protein D3C78_1314430 [compost metagenome]
MSRIGYFSKFQKISEILQHKNRVGFFIEIIRDHQSYLIGSGDIDNESGFIDNFVWHVEVLRAARKIAGRFFEPIHLKTFEISKADENDLFKYASLIDGDIVEHVEAGHEFCRGKFTPDGSTNFDESKGEERDFFVRFTESDGGFFNMLGNHIKAPPININIEHCLVSRFSYTDDDNNQEGFIVSSCDETKYVMSIDKERQWVLDANN